MKGFRSAKHLKRVTSKIRKCFCFTRVCSISSFLFFPTKKWRECCFLCNNGNLHCNSCTALVTKLLKLLIHRKCLSSLIRVWLSEQYTKQRMQATAYMKQKYRMLWKFRAVSFKYPSTICQTQLVAFEENQLKIPGAFLFLSLSLCLSLVRYKTFISSSVLEYQLDRSGASLITHTWLFITSDERL